MCIDMGIDMCVDMSVDMCIDMWRDQCDRQVHGTCLTFCLGGLHVDILFCLGGLRRGRRLCEDAALAAEARLEPKPINPTNILVITSILLTS